MNISIKNFDSEKVKQAILSEAKKLKDPNLRFSFLCKVGQKVNSLGYDLEKESEAIYKAMEKKESLVACPHCMSMISRKELAKEASKKELVKGSRGRSIDLGPDEGWDVATESENFFQATCRYCKKTVYSTSAIFNGKLWVRPHAFSGW